MKQPTLTSLVQSFLTDFPRQRGLSPQTILAYRDALKLLLRYAVEKTGKSVMAITIPDLDGDLVISFLDHLEQERKNSIATRNNRLIVIRGFFSHVALTEPTYAEHCRRVCAIPLKKAPTRSIPYLEMDEIQALLRAPNRATSEGRRDYALLLFLYNTGARVHELVGVQACDLQLRRPRQVLLHGKGKKDRWCPLWEETANVLSALLEEEGIAPTATKHIFRNRQKDPLTRFGVDYLLKKYGRVAVQEYPALARKRLSPHTIRHTTAVHLLNSGVDLNVIRSWLGHADLSTTNIYAEINQETKRKALETCNPAPEGTTGTVPSWRKQDDVLAWLESL